VATRPGLGQRRVLGVHMRKFFRSEEGASAAEYVLLLALLGGGVAFSASAFGGSISTALGNAGAAVGSLSFDTGNGSGGNNGNGNGNGNGGSGGNGNGGSGGNGNGGSGGNGNGGSGGNGNGKKG
jgi:Flp pilus assembly pilin Flp